MLPVRWEHNPNGTSGSYWVLYVAGTAKRVTLGWVIPKFAKDTRYGWVWEAYLLAHGHLAESTRIGVRSSPKAARMLLAREALGAIPAALIHDAEVRLR